MIHEDAQTSRIKVQKSAVYKLNGISLGLYVTQLGLGDGAFTANGEVVFVHQHIQHPAHEENGNSDAASSDQVAQMSSWHLFQVEL